GYFDPSKPIPWRPEQVPKPIEGYGIKSKKGAREEIVRTVPVGYVNSSDDQAVSYDETQRYEKEDKKGILSSELECAWVCPGPGMGPATVMVNVQLRGGDDGGGSGEGSGGGGDGGDGGRWIQLSFSLRESAICVSEKKTDEGAGAAEGVGGGGDGPSVVFAFDQVDRHRKFFEFVRDKEWGAVGSFMDKKAVCWNRGDMVRRKYRVMNVLASIFDSAAG
ncbi:hypothetical protein B484DRAFT_391923, partial [Ochromonadaceae sp. CCMP2298]